MKNTKLTYEKPYQGPFSRTEALELANGFASIAKPSENSIHGARIKLRQGNQYDVEILVEQL